MQDQHAIQKLSKRLLVLLWIILITAPLYDSFMWIYGTMVESGRRCQHLIRLPP